MCYGSGCKFERYDGECGKPLSRMSCPVDFEDEEEDLEPNFDYDDYDYDDDRAAFAQWAGLDIKDSPI